MRKIEEQNNDLLDEVYTLCWVFKADVEEERKDLIQQYKIINFLLCGKFIGNKNLEKAIKYFSSTMQDFFDETEFENQVYEAMIDYFEHFENLTDCQNRELLEDFSEILTEFDNKVDMRFFEAQFLYEHYMSIITSGILTDKNYFYRGLTQKTDEEDRQVILGKIPEVKQDV